MPIDYIPCRDFSKAGAEEKASTPPAESADLPLDGGTVPASEAGSLTPYLASLYRNRLLSRDEEQFYFRRMNWLKYRASVDRRRLDRRRATTRQMERVEQLLAEATKARDVLVTANLRLVVSIAKNFVDQTWSFDDLVAEGNVVLMKAVEKFNFALGNRFSTYATYAIQRQYFRLSHRGRQYRSRFVIDDDPSRGQIDPGNGDGGCSEAQVGTLATIFSEFLGELEPRERKIVVARFGFDGKAPRTFRDLGDSMGVCKERIRQIQTRALEKLRSMADEAGLEQTVGDWL